MTIVVKVGVLLLLAPLVLFPDLLLLTWGKVILNIERLPDLLSCFSLDHVGHCLTGDVQQTLDAQIVSSQYQLKQSALVNLKEISVPG